MTATLRNEARTVYVTTAVELDPSHLEDEGWVFVGKGNDGKPPSTVADAVMDTVQRWHDEAHELPFMWCTERPCFDLRDA